MSLETGTYIGDLNPANPPGTDPKSQGDDHLRLLKAAVKNAFPGFSGSIMVGGSATGAADAYILSPPSALLAYMANTMVVFLPSATNTTTAPTLNISALGPRVIKAVNGAAVLPGDIQTGQYCVLIDTGIEYRLAGVTKNYIDNLVFSSALPSPPPGSLLYYLTYQNGVFSYGMPPVPDYLIQAQGVV